MWHAHTWLPSLSPSRVLGKSRVKPKVNFTGNPKSTAETRKFQQRWRNVRLYPPIRSNEGRHLWRQHVGPEDGCPHSVRDNTDQHTLKCRTSPGEDPLWVFGVLLTVFNRDSQKSHIKLKKSWTEWLLRHVQDREGRHRAIIENSCAGAARDTSAPSNGPIYVLWRVHCHHVTSASLQQGTNAAFPTTLASRSCFF